MCTIYSLFVNPFEDVQHNNVDFIWPKKSNLKIQKVSDKAMFLD